LFKTAGKILYPVNPVNPVHYLFFLPLDDHIRFETLELADNLK
jgi:hypothetical protein